ncbi:MAG TPA: TIGR03089 family protein [Dermatophilaceae bacterium]|nr:TIGR03089 family protein [Dermatophilaceae bacterium]
MTTLQDVLRGLRERNPTSPRLTWYGPGGQERVELSGRVLDNWVSKAGNLLLEELEEPVGARVRISLTAGHWRFWYWSLAVLTVGGTVLLDPEPVDLPGDLTISMEPSTHGDAPLVLVTPQALARSYPGNLPAGAIDEARVLLTFPDVLTVDDTPEDTDIAIAVGGEVVDYRDLVPPVGQAGPVRLHLTSRVGPVNGLRAALGVWAHGGSVVVTPPGPAELVERIRRSEAVTTNADTLPSAGLSGTR